MLLQELLNTGNYFTDKGRYPNSTKYYDTSKVDLHNYIPTYENLFNDFKNKSIDFLEIGIYNGGSLKLWRDYFTHANITGIDIVYTETAKNTLANTNVNVYLSDSTDSNSDVLITKIQNTDFDIIIDDGCHSFESQYKTLQNYWKKLKNGGIYIIEDIEPRTLYNSNFISMFKMISDFEIINLSKQDNRDDSILFIFRK
jgi:SAM-dependent methyltransferase